MDSYKNAHPAELPIYDLTGQALPVELGKEERAVRAGEQGIVLSELAFRLWEIFQAKPNQLTRIDELESAWVDKPASNRLVIVAAVNRLRRKIGHKRLTTVKAQGFIYDPESREAYLRKLKRQGLEEVSLLPERCSVLVDGQEHFLGPITLELAIILVRFRGQVTPYSELERVWKRRGEKRLTCQW